jgi:hypothetical protein
MAYDIRPLSFSEILDRAFRVLLDNLVVLFAISALVSIPVGVLLEIGTKFVRPATISILGFTVLFVVIPVQHAALIVGVGEVYLDRAVSVEKAFRTTLRLAPAVIGTYLLVGVIIFFGAALGAIVVGGLVGAVLPNGGAKTPSMLMGLIIAIVVASGMVYFLTRWALTGPVMILERRFGWRSLRRSRALVKGAWWQTLGIVVVAAIIANAPAYALGFVWRYIPIAGSILGSATHALSTTYGMVVSVIYYFDRRCRTEDFDLRLLAEQVRAETQPSMSPAPDSSALA